MLIKHTTSETDKPGGKQSFRRPTHRPTEDHRKLILKWILNKWGAGWREMAQDTILNRTIKFEGTSWFHEQLLVFHNATFRWERTQNIHKRRIRPPLKCLLQLIKITLGNTRISWTQKVCIQFYLNILNSKTSIDVGRSSFRSESKLILRMKETEAKYKWNDELLCSRSTGFNKRSSTAGLWILLTDGPDTTNRLF